MSACFHNPVSTVFGAGSLARVAELCTGKVTLVTFPEAAQLGLADVCQIKTTREGLTHNS